MISAGLDNLPELVQKGLFRKDLYQRLAGYSITLLPLCERKEDIMPFIREVTSSTRRIAFSDDAKEKIMNYSWPGNVRQLRHFARVLSTLSRGIVTPEQVEASIVESSSSVTTSSLVTQEQLFLIRKIGMKPFLQMFQDEVIRSELEKHGERGGLATIEALKISESTYYRFTQRSGIVKSRKSKNSVDNYQTASTETVHEIQ